MYSSGTIDQSKRKDRNNFKCALITSRLVIFGLYKKINSETLDYVYRNDRIISMNIDIPTRRALAEKCGIGDDYLYQVLTGRKICSAELCVSIEKQSKGVITRQDLRPGDWHLIWPELVKARKQAKAVA